MLRDNSPLVGSAEGLEDDLYLKVDAIREPQDVTDYVAYVLAESCLRLEGLLRAEDATPDGIHRRADGGAEAERLRSRILVIATRVHEAIERGAVAKRRELEAMDLDTEGLDTYFDLCWLDESLKDYLEEYYQEQLEEEERRAADPEFYDCYDPEPPDPSHESHRVHYDEALAGITNEDFYDLFDRGPLDGNHQTSGHPSSAG